jgi:hypothetical protein
VGVPPGSGAVCFALFAKLFASFAVRREDKAKPQRSPSQTQSFAKKNSFSFQIDPLPPGRMATKAYIHDIP